MSALVAFSDCPLISVVMPVYNAERYVAEAIHSILAQTYSHFEFIIVDDGSSDGTVGVVRDLVERDARIHPLFLSHRGQSYALNAGIALAQGAFIAHMDNDDIALPERLALQLTFIRKTNVDICGGYLQKFGDQNGFLWFPETHDAICIELLFRIGLHHGTSLLRAEIAKAHLFDEQVLHTDYEMLTRLAPRYYLGNVPQILLKHRCHAQQAHVVYSSAFLADLHRFRKPYFHTLFPKATAEDYDALARVAENESFSNLADLEHSGRWLVRLAQTQDNFLRERMASRWRTACQKSTHLGLGCYRLYQQLAPQFDVASNQKTFELWLGCGLQLKAGSRLLSLLKRVKNMARRQGVLA